MQLDGTDDGTSPACTFTPQVCEDCDPIEGAATVTCQSTGDSGPASAADGYFLTAEHTDATTDTCISAATDDGPGDPDFEACAAVVALSDDVACMAVETAADDDGDARACEHYAPGEALPCQAGGPCQPATVTECAPIENALILTVSCTDESNSVPSSVPEGYYIYAECADDPDWEYTAHNQPAHDCAWYASNQERCGEVPSGAASEACPVACGACGELSTEVFASACTPIEGAATVICTDESDSEPTSAAVGYFIGEGACADDPDWIYAYLGSFCEDMFDDWSSYGYSSSSLCTWQGDYPDERTMREACPATCGACDDAVIPDAAIACTPIDGADTVLCTNADDQVVAPGCDPGKFLVQNIPGSGECVDCTPVEGASDVECTMTEGIRPAVCPLSRTT
eukprot:COSAG06_NODE_1994_length_7889_cov_8.566752_1_plen_399_part_00